MAQAFTLLVRMEGSIYPIGLKGLVMLDAYHNILLRKYYDKLLSSHRRLGYLLLSLVAFPTLV